jgi:CheY-like chemotaxis protein
MPDVIISDIGMPEKDGYQLIREVRNLGATRGGNVPAIALTAFARPEDRMKAMLAGYQTHLPKPVEANELIATIRSLTRWAHRPDK